MRNLFHILLILILATGSFACNSESKKNDSTQMKIKPPW